MSDIGASTLRDKKKDFSAKILTSNLDRILDYSVCPQSTIRSQCLSDTALLLFDGTFVDELSLGIGLGAYRLCLFQISPTQRTHRP